MLAGVLTLVLAACTPPAPPESGGGSSRIAHLLAAEADAGFLRAEQPPALQFPRDHGPHDGYRTEWWYFTGNLDDDAGRRFGYQLTVFRQMLSPSQAGAVPPADAPRPSDVARLADAVRSAIAAPGTVPPAEVAPPVEAARPLAAAPLAESVHSAATPSAANRASPADVVRPTLPVPPSVAASWRAQHVYLAHLAISDVSAGTHVEATRLTRGALGQAETRVEPLLLRVEDFRIEAEQVAPATPWHLSLEASDLAAGIGITLELRALREPVAHGENGLSRKGPDAASNYYSITRLATTGTLTAAGRAHGVRGLSWMDREWSTSALSPEQIGWDWFSLQLDDGRDLMLFRLRRRDGARDAYDAGTLLAADGAVTRLTAADFALDPLAWFDDEQGGRWPTAWRLQVRDETFEARAVLADQLLRGSLRYWEGAVRVDGAAGGRGYLEMTGY